METKNQTIDPAQVAALKDKMKKKIISYFNKSSKHLFQLEGGDYRKILGFQNPNNGNFHYVSIYITAKDLTEDPLKYIDSQYRITIGEIDDKRIYEGTLDSLKSMLFNKAWKTKAVKRREILKSEFYDLSCLIQEKLSKGKDKIEIEHLIKKFVSEKIMPNLK